MSLDLFMGLGLVVLGLAAGILSGLIGIGGGVIIVPVLVLLFGLSQHSAQGTTLTLMLPPIGVLAVLTYYKAGYVDWRVAALLCIGFVFGGWLGARFAVKLPDAVLTKIFAISIILIGIKMFFTK